MFNHNNNNNNIVLSMHFVAKKLIKNIKNWEKCIFQYLNTFVESTKYYTFCFLYSGNNFSLNTVRLFVYFIVKG